MAPTRRDRLLVPLLALGCFVLAVLQRPGVAVTDTKIDLHVDPLRFLSDAAAPWSSDISLGHVQSGQYGGYMFPQGPFFALWRELGLSPWLVERLWLGAIYALAAWGVVRLLDALLDRRRGVAHGVAAAAFVLNPYVVTYTSRVSVSLLAYAALPWLLLCVHRGLRDRDGAGWMWPAVFALIVTSSGGGINAAVTAWALLGPLLLLIYEPFVGPVRWGAVRGFVWRTALLGAVTSLWWVVPLFVQAKWGQPFLPYTEQPGTIWGSTSVSESLRLMGFWLSYVGVGYGGRLVPYTGNAGVLLFRAPVIVASLLVPAFALGGFASTRRWRYAPFFLAMTLIGVLVMAVGFPEGTPLRKGVTFAYNHFASLDFLRTTYKAGPLPALGLAVLSGVAARGAVASLVARPRAMRFGVVAFAALLLAGSAWPLMRGRGVDDKLTWNAIPASWRAVASDLDRTLGDDSRAMVLPGQLFSSYRWGTTVDPILPTLARRPVAVRQVVPFADLRSVDLQWGTDALITQRRAVPGQLAPLLRLQAVGSVVTGADDDRARSGALGANEAARVLREQLAPGNLGMNGAANHAAAMYGRSRLVAAQAGELAAPLRLPEVRRVDTGYSGLVRLLPRGPATVVDGSADALLELSAFGALPSDVPIRYAADLSASQLRAEAAAGASVVISDSNRRRVFVPSRLLGNVGATLAPGDPISADGHQLNPWPALGTDAQTVAQIKGVASVRAPFSPQVTQFPEHRPFAAIDGDPSTAWIADRTLTADRWHLDVALAGRRDVPYVDLLPYGDSRGRVKAVKVNGRRFAVRSARWNRLAVNLRAAKSVSVLMADVTNPPAGVSGGAGGIRELRIPGVRATEALRPPMLVRNALRGVNLDRSPLTYLFQRTTGDVPFARGSVHGPWQAGEVRDRGDAEGGLQRLIDLPAARRWSANAWVSVAPSAPDDALDALAGGLAAPAAVALTSSDRFEGRPGYRASSAFDGSPKTAWIGGWLPGTPAPRRPPGALRDRAPAWIAWSTASPKTLHKLRVVAPAAHVRRPVDVRVVADGVDSPVIRVGADGAVDLPTPLRGRAFRLDVLRGAFPPGTSPSERRRRAVGIAELQGTGVANVAPPRSGSLPRSCDVRFDVGSARFALRPIATVGDLDAGRPMLAQRCGSPVALGAGPARLRSTGGPVLRVDQLSLTSVAPGPEPASAPLPFGRVLDVGTPRNGRRDGIRLDVQRPAWLVLGESWSAGWRATCDGRDLGAPVPLEGYATAWPVDRGCKQAYIVFAGNRLTSISGWISLIAALALLALAGVAIVRRRRAVVADPAPAVALAEPSVNRWPMRKALAFGAAAALAGAFVFALRAGILIGPAVAFVLWRGLGPRALALAAGALLAIGVPALYLAVPVADKGGYNSNLPLDRIAGHWVAVAAVVLLIVALVQTLAAARRGSERPGCERV